MDGDLGGLMGILFMFGFLFIGCFEFELNKFFDNWLDWLIDLFKLFILFKRKVIKINWKCVLIGRNVY